MSGARPEAPPPTCGPDDPTGGGLVAEAAHELHAPIAALVAAAETLDGRWEQLSDQERRRLVSVLLARSRRLSHLVVELLDLSRLAAADMPVRARSVAVAAQIRSAVEEAGLADVVISCPDDVAVTVDPGHLSRILVNLLVNARQHGFPPVTVEADVRDGQLEIRVVDRGPGVPHDLVPRLFDPFSRAMAGPDRPDQNAGAGLGLAIVKGLARTAGGDAFYRPQPSGGAVFGVRLPAG